MSRYSVCIVSYNNADNILSALQSIYGCGAAVDVYLSDNASSDNTVSLVKERYPQTVIVQNEKNGGFGTGHNAVLPLLRSELHFIVNPDVIVPGNVFREFDDYFENNPGVVMAVPRFTDEAGNEQFSPKLRPTIHYMLGGRLERFGGVFRRWRDAYTLRGQTITEPMDIGFCSGCFLCVRTDIFRRLGGFDERYFLYNEDADITREAQQYGRTMYLPHITVIHKWERAYMKNVKYLLIQINSMCKYFWKWRRRK